MFKNIKHNASALWRWLRQRRTGVLSLAMMTLVFVPAFMIISQRFTNISLAVIRNTANHRNRLKMHYLAKAAETTAMVFAKNSGLGANAENQREIMDILTQVAAANGVPNCADLDANAANGNQPCAGFSVVGRAADNTQLNAPQPVGRAYISAPAPYKDEKGVIRGTGTAAEKCAEPENADDPCHWNTLEFMEAVEVPLYYEDGENIVKLFEGGPGAPNDFVLRLRTPCGAFVQENGAWKCSENFELYPAVADTSGVNYSGPYSDVDKDKVIVQWMINDEAGSRKTMIARDQQSENFRPAPTTLQNAAANTELSAGRINEAAAPSSNDRFPPRGGNATWLQNYIVLENMQEGEVVDPPVDRLAIGRFIANSAKPVLRLEFVTRPKKNPNDMLLQQQILDNENKWDEFWNDAMRDVPVLEYQVLTRRPIADEKTFVLGWAKIGDFYRELTGIIKRPVTASGFALGNL